MEILTNHDLREIDIFSAEADNTYLSLTTTPPRLCNQDFEKTINSLLDQTVVAKKIFVNVPISYRRTFHPDFSNDIVEKRIYYLRNKYPSLHFVRPAEDLGPATKLLGTIDSAPEVLDPESLLIVVDDDIEYSKDMIWCHVTTHALYQCDLSSIDQRQLIQIWEPYKFHKHNELFVEDTNLRVYGFLSFAIKFKSCANIKTFFQKAWDEVPESFFHDDAIFSGYLKAFKLYTVRINVPSLRNKDRLSIDGEAGCALREIEESSHQNRLYVEAKIDEISSKFDNESNFYIPKNIKASPIRGTSNIRVSNSSRNFHVLPTFVNKNSFILTISIFDETLINQSLDVVLKINDVLHRICIHANSTKASYLFASEEQVYPDKLLNESFTVIQTAQSSKVTKTRLYSACTVIGNTLGVQYKFIDDAEMDAYINNKGSVLIRYAYKALNPGAYKADLFRYLYLYNESGLYIDCKALLNASLSQLCQYEDDNLQSCMVKDQVDGYIYISLLLFKNRYSEVLKSALSVLCYNVLNRLYNSDFLSITGPGIFREVFCLRAPPKIKLENKRLNNSDDWQESGVLDEEGNCALVNSYKGYYDELGYLSGDHYSVMYNKRLVFKDGASVKYSSWSRKVFRGIDSILWINLDRAVTRKEGMERMLDEINIPNIRVSAYDGNKNLPVDTEGLSSKYEIGCLLSHLSAIRQLSAMKGDYFIILEDDMELNYLPLLRGVDTIESIVKRAPDDWEVILLSWIYNKPMENEFVDWSVMFNSGPEGHIAGTGAYLINRRGVDKLCSRIKELTTQYVHENATVAHADGRRLIADVYLYSNFTSYVYRNRLFKAVAVDSFINQGDIDWHTKTQTILLNALPGNCP